MKHPSRMDLFEYAEILVDKSSAIPVRLAGHVAHCRACAHEVERIRSVLVCVAKASELEPTEGSTRQILAAAREERRRLTEKPRRVARVFSASWRAIQAMSCAAIVMMMASVSFRVILNESNVSSRSPRVATSRVATQPASVHSDLVKKASVEIGELANVLQETPRSISPAEQRNRRLAFAMREDLAAATLALERNPGCERARNLMTLNLARQADVLKRIYIERTL